VEPQKSFINSLINLHKKELFINKVFEPQNETNIALGDPSTCFQEFTCFQ
jgi:hypothetical protein